MIDSLIRAKLAPYFDKVAPTVAQSGLSANKLTLIGLSLGLLGCFFAAMQIYALGLVFLVVSRLIDAMDGAVARTSNETNLGSFMDFFSDFVIYAAFPMFFILGAPEHALMATILLFTYVLMILAYLLHHLFALKMGATQGAVGGIVENGEMIVFMILCCVFPFAFSAFAIFFALMCLATAGLRAQKIVKLLKG